MQARWLSAQSLGAPWTHISWFSGFSCIILDPSCSYSPFSPISTGFHEFALMFGRVSLHVFPSVAGWSFIDDNYARLQSMSIAVYHSKWFHWFYLFIYSYVCQSSLVLSRSLGYPSSSQPSRQFKVWASSCGMGPKLASSSLGHSHKFYPSFTPSLPQQDNCR